MGRRKSSSLLTASEPLRADGVPSIHAPDQRIQQEASEPESVGRAALRALQFRARASDAALYAPMAAGVTGRLWSVAELLESASQEQAV